MPKETRKALNAPTNSEISEKVNAKRERDLQENIAAILRQRGIWFFRQRMDRKTTGPVGTPDFLLAIRGQAVAIECKLPGFEPTTDQQECMAEMNINGWNTYVVTSEQSAVAILNFLKA